MRTIQIRITGKVQGVFYRQSALRKAMELGINGTVQNCDDDSVQIIATGEKNQLDALISWCWQGPPKAKVTNVSFQELPLHQFNNFIIIR